MNTPRINPLINPDDPKWTAYVLGELGETERVEIEQLLATSDEARALIEELSVAAMTLKDELSPMTSFMMTPEQRAVIESAAQPAPAPKRSWAVFPSKWGWGLAAAAAGLLLVIALPRMNRESRVAVNVAPPADTAANISTETKRTEAAQTPQAAASGKKAELAIEAQPQPTAAPVSVAPVLSPAEVAKLVQGIQEAPATNAAPPPPPPAAPPVQRERGRVEPTSRGMPGGIQGGVLVGELITRDSVSIAGIRGEQEGRQAIQPAPLATPPATGPAAGGGRGGRGGGGGRGGAAAAGIGQGQGVRTTDTITGEAQLTQNLPNNEADLLRYLTDLAAARGGTDGNLNIRVDGFAGGALPQRPAAGPPPPPPAPGIPLPNRVNAIAPNTEAYDRIVDNPFIRTTQENLATFSIDVDTASYANMRRFLTQNQMPPRDSVRIEEWINYFNYDYAQPTGSAPIAPNMEVAATPWNPQSRLVRIGIKSREINANRRPPSNLVFLIDVSGSMNTPVKLPLVKAGLKMMVDRLGENDMVSIVVYAGASGLVLPPTSAIRKEVIQQAIDDLQPGGSTNGASGIQLAYAQAGANFIRGGTNRVILMTDGDFNVGVTNQGALTRLIEERAKSGVFLSVLGFGMGNIKDSTLEKLADQGNGHYAYIDNINEARKVLVEEMGATLVTVAKDVKIQVDFNPARVEAYRLIGYENRVLRTEDFNNDLKDAGDMGAGHTVTALFEVVPKGGYIPGPSIDPSKYTQQPVAPRYDASASEELLTLRVRYKLPEASTSTRMDVPLVDRGAAFARATQDFRFAASVASFGMILRDSPYRGNASMESVLALAQGSRGPDRNGYRQEFIELVQRARRLR